MVSPDENSAFPVVPGISWRSLQPVDVGAITALATLCLATDGGHPLGATETYVQERYLPVGLGVTIGGFDVDGQLVACAAVKTTHTSESSRVTIVGQVHPDYRRRGFGTFLLGWSIAEAGSLLAASPPDRPCILQITTESLTEPMARLFEHHGFELQFAEDVMLREGSTPIPDVLLPAGIKFANWVPALADQFFTVCQAAFRKRPGYSDWSQDEWIAWLAVDDDDFRPDLSLLAIHDDLPVGFIVFADRWIVQMGVRPEWCDRGIGSALVTEVLRRFQAAGGDDVMLDVNVNNPRAASVYSRLGFEAIGRRARFELLLT